MRRLLASNAFLAGLLAAVLLAFLFPRLGAADGPLRAGLLTNAGIMVIFLLQGLVLRPAELARGAGHFRLHALVQGWIFILAPAVLIPAGLLLRAIGHPDLGAGFLFLALVPTTISSAVAFTSAAGGNVAAALFNTTLANVFGVFWVPAGCLLFFSVAGGATAQLLLPLLAKLTWLILVPLLAGQLLRPLLHRAAWFPRITRRFKVVNHGIILFIVFTSFAQSVLKETWRDVPASALALVLLLSLCAVLLIHAGAWIASGCLLREPADRVTALFCGAQKTLAAGAPMAAAIFSADGGLDGIALGPLLLPLLCYHPLQLLLAALLLPRLGRPPQ